VEIHGIRGSFLETIEVNFQINDETYFLSLAENERQWLLFVSTPDGVRPVPIYEDAPPFEDVKIVLEDDEKKQIVN
jgi:hypothetical protein